MTHVKRFQGIPMSKSMRGLCKEEDYAFLGMSEKTPEGAVALEDDWRDKREERARWRLEREQQEKERLREIEESKKEKEQQWRTHVAKLTSSQEKTLQDRLARLRRFRSEIQHHSVTASAATRPLKFQSYRRIQKLFKKIRGKLLIRHRGFLDVILELQSGRSSRSSRGKCSWRSQGQRAGRPASPSTNCSPGCRRTARETDS